MAVKKLDKYKNWKGYKNAEDILPCAGDAVSQCHMVASLGFYVQGVSWQHGKPPMKISPHHEFDGVDCSKFCVIGFSIRIHWDFDTYKIPSPNRVVIIYDSSETESYEIQAKFVDWSKVQKWKPTFRMIEEK